MFDVEAKHDAKDVLFSIWLLLSFFILFGSLGPAHAASVTYYPSDYYVTDGTYVSGSVPVSLRAVDSDYFVVGSSPSATSSSSYHPSTYSLQGGTALVSGLPADLTSDNFVHMTFRSYPSLTSAQTLYVHQEATTVGGNLYFTQKPEVADLSGTSLSVSMGATGRQLLGRFIYPLTGLSSMPASTWTGFYRAWRDSDPSIAYDSVGSGNNGDGTSNITWTHVVGSGANRFMAIGISIRTVTVSVSSVTVGGQSATFIRSDVRGSEVKGEVWYLVNPDSGSKTVTVTLSGTSKACGGSVSYTGVAQTNPIDNHRSVSYGGTNPSISLTTAVSDDWVFSNLALCGTATVTEHGAGQVHRYYEVGTGGGGSSRAGADGDDKPVTVPGSYSMSWNVSFYSDVIAQAVAFKRARAPVGHVDVDIRILTSEGAIRTTLAANVADSGDLMSTTATLSGTYSMATYTVVDQTDYLEVDYYVEVASATSGVSAYMRIDDSGLPTSDQTKFANIMLPSEYTMDVEFMGASNTYGWTELVWVVDSSWSIGSVGVTVQLYDYVLGGYPVSGDGFVSYTANATANIEETRTQVVATSPQRFHNATGYWKVKVKGVKAVKAPFDFKADWVEVRSTYCSEYAASTEFMFSSIANTTITQLDFTVVSEYGVAGISVTVQVWNYSSSAYVSSGQGYLGYVSSDVNETKSLSIDVNEHFYTANGSAKMRLLSLLLTTTPYQERINQVRLDVDDGSGILPFNWFTVLLFALPVPFVGFFLWLLWNRRRKNAKSRVWETMTAFSEQFGMSHEQMVGRKMLLEVDPASDYNVALSGFVSEARNNGEMLFVVTNRNSALHSVFSSAKDVDFLLLTSKTHYPQQISEKETILPASDLSVLLDSCVKMQANAGKTVNLLLDNLSDIILRCDFDKTYKFTRLLLEALSLSKTTALFVFVSTAHDQEVSSSIRSLFHTQLAYTQDGPKTGNL